MKTTNMFVGHVWVCRKQYKKSDIYVQMKVKGTDDS